LKQLRFIVFTGQFLIGLVKKFLMYLRPGGELVLLDEEDIHGTMGFINSEQTLKSGSQGVIKTPISLPVSSKLRHFHP
jgi:hypothetical protein